MARIPSSSGAKAKSRKDVIVSILLTESTASLFSPKIPYLEELNPPDSHTCTICPSETNYRKTNNSQLCLMNRGSFDNKSLISEVAYFQYGSFSSISVPETSSEDSTKIYPIKISKSSLPYILKPTKIHARPLVAVRSLAHDDRLDIHLNKIYVSLLDSGTSIESEYMCRICHGGESVDDLLTPCRCRGTLALVHLKCLERWLLESSRSYCELCQHHYEIVREPRYNIIMSVLMFVVTPGPQLWDFLLDFGAFVAYTPTAVASTYSLTILCENIAKSETHDKLLPNILGFLSILGIAAIDFTYTSWLMVTLQKNFEAWKEFRRNSCDLKLILPNLKKKVHKRKNT